MSLALHAEPEPVSIVGARPAVAGHPNGHSQPVFVDPSGRRARRCRKLLAAAAGCALMVIGILVVLTVMFVRSAVLEPAGPGLAAVERSAVAPTAVAPTAVADDPADARR